MTSGSKSFFISGKRPVTVIFRFTSYRTVSTVHHRDRDHVYNFHCQYTMNNYTTSTTIFFKLINEMKILLNVLNVAKANSI